MMSAKRGRRYNYGVARIIWNSQVQVLHLGADEEGAGHLPWVHEGLVYLPARLPELSSLAARCWRCVLQSALKQAFITVLPRAATLCRIKKTPKLVNRCLGLCFCNVLLQSQELAEFKVEGVLQGYFFLRISSSPHLAVIATIWIRMIAAMCRNIRAPVSYYSRPVLQKSTV